MAHRKKGEKLISNLQAVNDFVERGFKLIEDYNKLMTKNEDQKDIYFMEYTVRNF